MNIAKNPVSEGTSKIAWSYWNLTVSIARNFQTSMNFQTGLSPKITLDCDPVSLQSLIVSRFMCFIRPLWRLLLNPGQTCSLLNLMFDSLSKCFSGKSSRVPRHNQIFSWTDMFKRWITFLLRLFDEPFLTPKISGLQKRCICSL